MTPAESDTPPSRWRRWATGLLGGGVVLWLAGAWVLSSLTLHPPYYHHASPEDGLWLDWDTPPPFWMGMHTDPKSDHGLEFENVEFSAEDGATLRGWFVPAAAARSGPRAVVLAVHGGGGDRRDWLRHVPVFHDVGLPVLLFDCREHGISDGRGDGIRFGAREYRDVISAVDWAKGTRGFERVAVAGTSQGGASVLLAAARDARIDAVIAENPFTTMGALLTDQTAMGPIPLPILLPLRPLVRWRTYGSDPQPIDVVDRIAPRPILFIHGTEDRVIPHRHSEELYARAGEPKELWLAPGAEHTTSFNHHPDAYRSLVHRFLATHLR